ncbi:MAG: sterol desaturase family protein [Alphaproteobacteria bacterium]|nr:sterol desaturase family protein [Alphaproteobacteria bacterium]
MLQPVVALVVLAVLFAAVERLAPSLGHRRRWRDRRTDVAWFLTGPLVRAVARGATLVVLVAVALALGWRLEPETVGFGPLGAQPRWAQALQIVVLSDLLGYALHRAFHSVPWLWRIHAVHHSSTHLDWLAAARVHPLNTVLATPARTVPLVLLGYDPTSVAAAIPLLTLYAIFLHSDVRWRFGALGAVLATPAFHRWHHAVGTRANYGGLLTVWDRLFGTHFLPEEDPRVFGVDDGPVPDGFAAQLFHPWRAATDARG